MTAHFDNGDELTFTVTEKKSGHDEVFTPEQITVTIPCELDAGADVDAEFDANAVDADAGDADDAD